MTAATSLLLVLLLASQDDDVVTYGNVLVRRPEGWKAEAKDESLVLQPEGEAYLVMMFPGTDADGTLDESLENAWKRAAGASKIVSKAPGKELKTEGGTDGLMSVGLLETSDGGRIITAVAVFKPGDRSQMVVAWRLATSPTTM